MSALEVVINPAQHLWQKSGGNKTVCTRQYNTYAMAFFQLKLPSVVMTHVFNTVQYVQQCSGSNRDTF